MARKNPKKTKRLKQQETPIPVLVHIISCLVIIIITVAVYANTLHYPFQFDDLHRIENNHHIRNFSDLAREYPFFKGKRSVVNFTLWMNYKLGEKNDDGTPTVEGMHLLNIFIHAFNGMLVYLLACAIIGKMTGGADERKRNETDGRGKLSLLITRYSAPILGIFAGLVFTLHPVQTESVTYLITRSEVLAVFFCLIGLLLYISLIPARSMLRFILIIVGIIIVYALGLESKEWVPVLPFLMLLVDYILISGADSRKFLKRFEETSTPILIMLIMTAFYLYNLNTAYRGDLDAGFGIEKITHGQYFLSQFNVMAYYTKLFFLPTNLRLDYDFPVVASVAHFPTYITMPFIALLLTAGIISVRRSPMFSFATLWFFIAIAPYAGIIPIADLAFEHRLYMPMVGFSIFAVYFIWRLFQVRLLRGLHYLTYPLLAALVAVYAVGTVNRNKVWSSIESLWEDAAAKSPDKARPHSNLGLRYLHMYREGDQSVEILDKAEKYLLRAAELYAEDDPGLANTCRNIGLVYYAKADAKVVPKDNLSEARKYYNRSIGLTEKRTEKIAGRTKKEGKYNSMLKEALEKQLAHFKDALGDTYNDLAVSYEYSDEGVRYGEGFDLEKAVAAWDKALEHTPDNTDRLWSKAVALVNGGSIQKGAEAIKQWAEGSGEQSPADLFYENGFAAFTKKNYRNALNYLEVALILDPEHRWAENARKTIEAIRHGGN